MKRDRAKLITAILPKGTGVSVVRSLRKKKGIETANVSSARGMGTSTAVGGKRGVGQQMEKDILNVTVSQKDADSIFEFIYKEAGIGKPHGGFMYMTRLTAAVSYLLPDLPEEK